jgi:hypothetical protein
MEELDETHDLLVVVYLSRIRMEILKKDDINI